MSIQNIIYIIVGAWLFFLTGFTYWIFNNFRNLTKGVKEGDLIKILKRVLDVEVKNTRNIKKIEKEIKRIDVENLLNVQKVGQVRFNPFSELGGDHSFAIALLDGDNNGIILTGLHTRERTRVYLKEVKSDVICLLEASHSPDPESFAGQTLHGRSRNAHLANSTQQAVVLAYSFDKDT